MVLKYQRGFLSFESLANHGLSLLIVALLLILLVPSCVSKFGVSKEDVVAANKVQQATITQQAEVIKQKDAEIVLTGVINQNQQDSSYALNKDVGGITSAVQSAITKMEVAEAKKNTTKAVSVATNGGAKPQAPPAPESDESLELAQVQIDAIWDLYNLVKEKAPS